MDWFVGTSAAGLWAIAFAVALAIAVLAAIAGIFFAWKKRSVMEAAPLPHCNLEERLGQIAQANILQTKKTA